MMNRIKSSHLVILTLVWLCIHGLFFYHYGTRHLWDADVYVAEADNLLQHGTLASVDRVFYFVHIGAIALSRWLFADQILPYLIFQCVVSGLAALSLYRAASIVFNHTLAGLFSALIFLVWWDNLQWNTVAMTESMACSIICFLLFRLTIFRGRWRDFVVIVPLLLLGLFVRPTGVIVIVSFLVFLLCYYRNFLIIHRTKIIGSALASIALILYLANAMLAEWDFTHQYEKGNIITYADQLGDGRTDTLGLRMPSDALELAPDDALPVMKIFAFVFYNPLYFIKSASLKVWYLLSSTRPYYSTRHNVYALLWCSFVYIFFVAAYQRSAFMPINAFVLSVIVFNCALIGISSVDWDNRFYIPMEPGIVLFAGGGLAKLVTTAITGKMFSRKRDE